MGRWDNRVVPTATASEVPVWRSRIVGSGEEAPDQLLANPANWRLHPKAQQDALAGLLGQVGWVQQVLVNRRTGHVVDGHLRVALAISQEAPTVPVLYVDLEPEEEALVLASLDPLAAMAGTDDEQLRALLDGVSVDSDDLAAMLVIADELAQAGRGAPDERRGRRPTSTSPCSKLLADAPSRAEAEQKLAALKAIPENLDGIQGAVYGFADFAKGNVLGSAVDGLFGANPAQVNEEQIKALEDIPREAARGHRRDGERRRVPRSSGTSRPVPPRRRARRSTRPGRRPAPRPPARRWVPATRTASPTASPPTSGPSRPPGTRSARRSRRDPSSSRTSSAWATSGRRPRRSCAGCAPRSRRTTRSPRATTSSSTRTSTALFARIEVEGYQRMEYVLSPEAIELGLRGALPAILEVNCQIGEFGRGERI